MSYIFQQIAKRGVASGIDLRGKTEAARAWYRATAGKIANVNAQRLVNEPQRVVEQIDADSFGKLYMFFYDPKWKETLPFYDTFPLVFPIGPAAQGFLGLNMHYLAPMARAKLMDELYRTLSDQRYDANTKLKINYKLLNRAARFSAFKPCVKHYLNDHVQSRFIAVEPQMWDAALMLPTERFKKKDKDHVWKISQQGIQ